jgi:hypothetical protein
MSSIRFSIHLPPLVNGCFLNHPVMVILPKGKRKTDCFKREMDYEFVKERLFTAAHSPKARERFRSTYYYIARALKIFAYYCTIIFQI